MKELFCLLFCFVLLKRVEPFSYVRVRDKDFRTRRREVVFPSYSTLLYNEFVHSIYHNSIVCWISLNFHNFCFLCVKE